MCKKRCILPKFSVLFQCKYRDGCSPSGTALTRTLQDLQTCSKKARGLLFGSFTRSWILRCIYVFQVYLLKVINGYVYTTSYFKPTDRNSFIPRDSCHHPMWLKNIPRTISGSPAPSYITTTSLDVMITFTSVLTEPLVSAQFCNGKHIGSFYSLYFNY